MHPRLRPPRFEVWARRSSREARERRRADLSSCASACACPCMCVCVCCRRCPRGPSPPLPISCRLAPSRARSLPRGPYLPTECGEFRAGRPDEIGAEARAGAGDLRMYRWTVLSSGAPSHDVALCVPPLLCGLAPALRAQKPTGAPALAAAVEAISLHSPLHLKANGRMASPCLHAFGCHWLLCSCFAERLSSSLPPALVVDGHHPVFTRVENSWVAGFSNDPFLIGFFRDILGTLDLLERRPRWCKRASCPQTRLETFGAQVDSSCRSPVTRIILAGGHTRVGCFSV